MFGFNIIKGGKGTDTCKASIKYKDIIFESNLIDKFYKDKLFFEDEKYIVVLDGVILNKKEIQGTSEWKDCFIHMYETKGDTFFSEFRGSFSGGIYEKETGKILIISDHIASKFIYHYSNGDVFICSSMMCNMYELLNINNLEYELDDNAAICMLTYGYMVEDLTLCDKVKKIRPGDYLVFENGLVNIKTFYKIEKNINNNLTEDEAIEFMDKAFRKAVLLQFNKDKEYGYRHLVTLSGGYDARMTTWVAHEMGFKEQVNITFSQTNYWDEIIPKQIATDLKHEWIFKSLDNGLWLKDIDYSVINTGGNVVYTGTAHGQSLYKYLNLKSFGMMHTGQIGDGINGSYLTRQSNGEFKKGLWGGSTRFIDKLNVKFPHYIDSEIGVIYTRALTGVLNGQQNTYNYTETISPFLDVDFINLCFSIPLEMREQHKLYDKWVLKKYPKAADYVWEFIGAKITEPSFDILGRHIFISQIPAKILRRLLPFKKSNTLKSMNPIGFYLQHNDDLALEINKFYKYKDMIKNKEIYNMACIIENEGTYTEKIQLITLLCALNNFFRK